ncbi:putative 5-3 exonuclease, partial [Pavlovales sp. CCMP2436]
MGVPGLFPWLVRRYGVEVVLSGEVWKAAYPSGCDCLYVDLNHLIHRCTHPEWPCPPPASEAQAFAAVRASLMRLVDFASPSTLLFVAIDGVAPRAKLNQQRRRRFLSAREAAHRRRCAATAHAELAALLGPEHAGSLPDAEQCDPVWDSNVITPGTAFLTELAEAVRYSLEDQLDGDPRWAKLQVIFSSWDEPGEGEHKAMRFVRALRARRTAGRESEHHALFGQDADLLLLSLCSHEPHFSVLRE